MIRFLNDFKNILTTCIFTFHNKPQQKAKLNFLLFFFFTTEIHLSSFLVLQFRFQTTLKSKMKRHTPNLTRSIPCKLYVFKNKKNLYNFFYQPNHKLPF